jgi:hypothetical protein
MLIHYREHSRRIGSTQEKNILQKDEWKTQDG